MRSQKNESKYTKALILRNSGLDSSDELLFPLLGPQKTREEKQTTSFILVGKGDSAGCGDFLPLLCCQVCMTPVLVCRKCGMKRCPHCYEKWVSEQASKIAITLMDAKRQMAWQRYPIKHVVISPDPRLYDQRVEDLRDQALAYLKKIGKGRDGVMMFHAFRPNERFWREYSQRGSDSDDDVADKKKWEWIRDKENWRDYVRYAPHFHFLGFVWMSPPRKGDVWIYKNVGIIEDGKELFRKLKRVAIYLLSHTVDKTDDDYFMPISWCGRLSHRVRAGLDMLRAYKDFLYKLKKKRKKSLHCYRCGGGIWFAEPNLSAFFKAWYGLHFGHYRHNISELKNIVRANLRVNSRLEIHRNVLKLLDLLGSGPPINPKGCQIVQYDAFLDCTL